MFLGSFKAIGIQWCYKRRKIKKMTDIAVKMKKVKVAAKY